ncbi:MFS general substrate transporter [Ganoderma sinense ZZ0214-1]|uniref:MFS general substrate transporter n=1 Tax=Ganoderma sinense ZZ0214-1 TaxID=1077348 RepID=A0A2G8S1J9_9APHY|nr:MFS general substrate transporter [Ganoderma sinense ZZ0214-1]
MDYKDDESELAYTGIETTALNHQSNSEDPVGSILVHSERSPTSNGKSQLDPFLVTFETAADIDPRKWSKLYLFYISLAANLLAWYSLLSSGFLAAFGPQIVAELKLKPWMVNLALSHYEICLCVASPLWGWLSDQHGRKRVLLICVNGVALFQMGCALSQSAPAMIFCRLMVGLFASGIFPITTAISADKCDFTVSEHGIGGFVLQFVLPPSGPGMSSMMINPKLGWRGIIWIFAIIAGVYGALIALTFPETHRPTILVNHAGHLRKQMHDHRYHAPIELSREGGRGVASSVILLMCEPVLILSAVYLALIVASLNIYYETVPVVSRAYHPKSVILIANLIVAILQTIGSSLLEGLLMPRVFRHIVLRRYPPESIPPEMRLIVAVISTPLLAIGLFWFGWSAFPNVNPGATITGSAVVGLSSIFLSIIVVVYIIDVYERTTATAIGWVFSIGNVFLVVLPVVSERMFRFLGVHWASTLSGLVTIVTIPILVVLMSFASEVEASVSNAGSGVG